MIILYSIAGFWPNVEYIRQFEGCQVWSRWAWSGACSSSAQGNMDLFIFYSNDRCSSLTVSHYCFVIWYFEMNTRGYRIIKRQRMGPHFLSILTLFKLLYRMRSDVCFAARRSDERHFHGPHIDHTRQSQPPMPVHIFGPAKSPCWSRF